MGQASIQSRRCVSYPPFTSGQRMPLKGPSQYSVISRRACTLPQRLHLVVSAVYLHMVGEFVQIELEVLSNGYLGRDVYRKLYLFTL